jgi:hypothetical protein
MSGKGPRCFDRRVNYYGIRSNVEYIGLLEVQRLVVCGLIGQNVSERRGYKRAARPVVNEILTRD